MRPRFVAAILTVGASLPACATTSGQPLPAKSPARPTAPAVSVVEGWCNISAPGQGLAAELQLAASNQAQGHCPNGIKIAQPGVVRIATPVSVDGLLRIRATGGKVVFEPADVTSRCMFHLSPGGALDLSGIRVSGSDDVQAVYSAICADGIPVDMTRYPINIE